MDSLIKSNANLMGLRSQDILLLTKLDYLLQQYI